MTDNSSQTVETVLGPVPISELGETLTHEHLASFVIKRNQYVTNCELDVPYVNKKEVSVTNIQTLDQFPYACECNSELRDDNVMRNMLFEISLFKQNRGKTIVNTNSYYHTTDLIMLRTISKMTGVNMIIGSEFTANFSLRKMQNITKEYLYNDLKKGLIEGKKIIPAIEDSPRIKSAFIGETTCYNFSELISTETTLSAFERTLISATGEVQAELRCPVTLYPGNNPNVLKEILRVYKEAGGDSSKAVISHVDFVFPKKQEFMKFVDDHKCYVEFSLFGTPCSIHGYFDILSDSQRIKRIKRLKEEGKLNRVLMSHDIHTKSQLVSYGGLGFAHISKNIQPFMLKRGFEISDMQTLMIENPKNWLSYNQTRI